MSSRLSQFTRVSYSARKSAPRPISTRPASVATSIAESSTSFECADERLPGWSRSDLDETTEESEDLEISDTESIESLHSRARKLAERFTVSNSSSTQHSFDDSDSDGARTSTSLTSYDEIPTPQNRSPLPQYTSTFVFDGERKDNYLHDQDSPSYEPIEFAALPTIGPKGPHLFRSSMNFASLPPLTIQTPTIPQTPIDELPSPSSPKIRPPSDLSSIVSNYTIDEVRAWTTSQVCAWMRTLGFESTMLEKFERNDITGALLVDLKWEDLKELEISSFGKRVALWSEIHHLRNGSSVCPSESSRQSSTMSSGSSRKQSISSQTTPSPVSTPIRESMQMQEVRGSPKPLPLDILTGAGPVLSSGSSIEDGSRRVVRKKDGPRRRKVNKAVRRKAEKANYYSSEEETAPAPKPCRVHSKKTKRCVKETKHTSETPSASGTILIATTASVVDTDDQMPTPPSAVESSSSTRPSSVVVPSVVASSDVLGAIEGRNLKLQEQYLREVSRVDPQESVKKFLINQHVQHLEERRASPPPVPTKTPADVARGSATRLTLQIPRDIPPRSDSMSAPVDGFSPIERGKTPAFGLRARAFPISQYGGSPVNRTRSPMLMRTTTPFSEMDVPLSHSPAPDMRNQSQSVPPDMRFRRFTPTPATPATIAARKASIARNFPSTGPAPITTVDENTEWTPSEDRKTAPAPPAGANLKKVHSGWMKKRKTNWFRHEWPEYHFELQGTRLGYAKNVAAPEEGFIEMDNYSVACSNTASTKLSAAFKSLRLKGDKKEHDKAFLFQLVPATDNRRKAVNGKVHYFTVGTREERIDWMRELMLAKAIKQKGHGFDVEVNGCKV